MIETLVPLRSRICVAIPTYRRREPLGVVLEAIARQRFPETCDVEVVVFDNDSEPSAQAQVARKALTFPVPLVYRHAPEPGLSAVRNLALAYARDAFDFIAMIDDDEEPKPGWLAELFATASRTHADATFGPVQFVLPSTAPRYLREGRFFHMPVHPEGSTVRVGYSGNCLLRTDALRRYGVWFDRALNFAGGEDMLFFRQLQARGATMVFSASAVATERVSCERLNPRYVVKLNYRRGNTLALCDLRLKPGANGVTMRAFKGIGRFFRGLVSFLPRSVMEGRIGALAAACDVAHGCGSIVGLFGVVYEAYGRGDAAP